jgi:hypothetical protein
MSNLDLTRRSMRRIEEQAPDGPLVCAAAPPPEPWTPDGQRGLDEATLSYVLAARPAFELLRQTASQLAALLILAAAGGRSAQDNPVFARACAGQAEARDLIGALRPGRHGAHHYRHLKACAEAVGAACQEASLHLHKGHGQQALARLREGLQHLHFAAAALPGFEVVAFGQSCCAAHASMTTAPQENANG